MKSGPIVLALMVTALNTCGEDKDGDGVETPQDCDDTNAQIYPGAPEACNGKDDNCDGVGDIQNNGMCYDSIQQAVVAADSGDTITLSRGTYLENEIIVDKRVTILGTDGPYYTFIDAEQMGRVFTITAIAPEQVTLQGLFITDGSVTDERGGGVYVSESSAVNIDGCWISGNTVIEEGGAGIYGATYASITIDNSYIDSNTAEYSGGGFGCYFCTTSVNNSVFSNNSSSGSGGGATDMTGGSHTFTNVLFVDNYARIDGAVTATHSGSLIYQNCAFSGNYNGSQPQHNIDLYLATAVVTNSIFWGNDDGVGFDIATSAYGSAVVTYSALTKVDSTVTTDSTVVFLSSSAEGNPFIDSEGENYHLPLDSSLINAGNPDTSDFDGTRSDMGCYGGAAGDLWDIDGDDYPNYFWPGTIDDAPEGFDPADYDAEDMNASQQ